MINGKQSRGGSSGRGLKVKPQKVILQGQKKTVKETGGLKRDARHVSHEAHSLMNGKIKFTHTDINTTDSRDGVKVTRSLNLRGGH